ncbi:MAG: hypothetical protein LGR52_11235 [Candidatus Thiosymbion ectosymbiont of Robbea hypermnestra]|nr:hypothetical protein [Candidatus Thiosymbion ectosymbiont of Robbea hypermnestra]
MWLPALAGVLLLPLVHRLHPNLGVLVFLAALAGITVVSGLGVIASAGGAPAAEFLITGPEAPFSIGLRLGRQEAFLSLAVNLVGLLGGWYLLRQFREQAWALVLFLLLVLGIDGAIMSRDLLGLFVSIGTTAVATRALTALFDRGTRLNGKESGNRHFPFPRRKRPRMGFCNTLLMGRGRSRATPGSGSLMRFASLTTSSYASYPQSKGKRGTRYVLAGGLASILFLFGTLLAYYLTGTLNMDGMIADRGLSNHPLGTWAPILLIAAVLIGLGPFPAHGRGLAVYGAVSGGIGAFLSVGVSTGALAALHKLLPLLPPDRLSLVAAAGLVIFLFAHLMGLVQGNAKRLLGYSSVAQLGLLVAAIAYLLLSGREGLIPLIAGGLFINHLLAKAGLFWLAGSLGRDRWRDWTAPAGRPWLLFLFGTLLFALAGLPPFPGFWARWELVLSLATDGRYGWLAVILLGSLLEAVYLLRWLGVPLAGRERVAVRSGFSGLAPPVIFAALLYGAGWYWTARMGEPVLLTWLPLLAGGLLFRFDRLPSRFVGLAACAILGAFACYLLPRLSGLAWWFGLIFLPGGILLVFASLYRKDARLGLYPLVTVLLTALGLLLQARTGLGFFHAWVLVTLSAYLLITLGWKSTGPALRYVLFSLAAAYSILAGLALGQSASGSPLLADLHQAGALGPAVFTLLALGFAIAIGGLGLHVWLPDAYAEAEDDVTALLASLVGKAGIFGLLVATIHLGEQAIGGLDIPYLLGWLGLLTAVFGALTALFQEDTKRLLAYAGLEQVGYILAGIALMSHSGWVAALYLSLNHFLCQGLLSLAVAGVIYRTGTRARHRLGGLIDPMPVSFFCALIAAVALSGLPPLTGFGGKWLLFGGLLEKHWYPQAGLVLFSSVLAGLYLLRLLHAVFFGPPRPEYQAVREVPKWLLLPQLVLVGMILLFSLFPQSLVQSISDVVAPHYAMPRQWIGDRITNAAGHWNGFLVMNILGAVLLVLLIRGLPSWPPVRRIGPFNIPFSGGYRVSPKATPSMTERPEGPATMPFAANLYPCLERGLAGLVRPWATRFWDAVCARTHSLAMVLYRLYRGPARAYARFIALYLAALAFLAGGGQP